MIQARAESVKVLIVDDKCLVNEGISALLSKGEEFDIVGNVLNGQACLEMLRQTPIDLVLLDHNMPGKTGLQTFKEIKDSHPFTKVIALTFLAEESLIRAYLNENIHGFLLKSDTSAELLFAARQVVLGKPFFSSGVAQALSGQVQSNTSTHVDADLSLLTPAELNVLTLIGQGLSATEISDKRFTSVKTVNRQKQTIMDKLGIHKETKLMRFAIQQGLT